VVPSAAPSAAPAFPGRLRLPVAAALAGALLATGHAPLGWSWPAFAALAALLALGTLPTGARAAALTGWAAGFGHFAAALFWIVEPFLVEPEAHGWMAPFALVLLPGGLALFWAAAFALAERVGGRVLPARLFALAVALAAAELARAHVLTGFPWALPGHIWIGAPQMQAAALAGAFGLTLATLLCAGLVAWPLRDPRPLPLAAAAAAVAALGGAGAWGSARLAAPDPDDPGLTVRLVQPNAAQDLKWDPAMAESFLARLLAETAAPAAGPAPDVTVWPETAVPWLLNGAEPILAEIAAAAAGRPVAFGIVRREGARVYNSLAVTDAEGGIAALYDKHHLTPFGEYLPFGEWFARLGIHGLAASEGAAFTPGPGPRVLDLGAAGRVLPLICYEAIFPRHLFVPERPDWVMQITNDAWFGTVSGPFQHLDLARLRAVEQGLPVVRAANTGVSAVIDAKGRVRASLPLGAAGHLDAALPAALPPTPYARLGEAPALAALAALALAALAAGLLGRRLTG
jgi:apolipoprotein N-acyltransferase